jgi:uncharacterized protein YcnI
MRHRARALLTAAAVVGLTIGLSAAAASAHVTVQPPTAPQGGFTKLSFRVPNEESDADTVKLEVQFPSDTPIPSVSVQPKDGWTYNVTTETLAEPIQSDDGPVTQAVTGITWEGGTIKPGEFDEFSVSVGPLPEVDSMQFKAVQTYSNGDVVRWIDQTTPGGAEPEHPAPTLTLTKADAATDSAAASTTSSSDDSTARTFGIIALVIGIIAVVVAVIALVTARRKPSTT